MHARTHSHAHTGEFLFGAVNPQSVVGERGGLSSRNSWLGRQAVEKARREKIVFLSPILHPVQTRVGSSCSAQGRSPVLLGSLIRMKPEPTCDCVNTKQGAENQIKKNSYIIPVFPLYLVTF